MRCQGFQSAGDDSKVCYSPRLTGALHFVGQLDVLTVDIELPLTLAENAGQYGSRVDTDPHVDRRARRFTHAPAIDENKF